MNILRKIKVILEEKHMLKNYIISGKVSKYLGELIGAKPYFMTFDEYKLCVKEEE